MDIQISHASAPQPAYGNQPHNLLMCSSHRPRQPLQGIKKRIPVGQISEREFANDHVIGNDPGICQSLLKRLVARPKVVYPDARVDQDLQ